MRSAATAREARAAPAAAEADAKRYFGHVAKDAVFLGTGAGLPWFMGIPGESACGVYSANELLTRVNLMGAYLFGETDTPVMKGKQVVVVGGGSSAPVHVGSGAVVVIDLKGHYRDTPVDLDPDAERLLLSLVQEGFVRQGLEAQLVQRVTGVGDQLPQEDVLLRVERVDHQL